MTPTPTPSAQTVTARNQLIEAEAKRRCIECGYSLDYLACQDRRFRHDDRRPWWQAMYFGSIESEIERIEKAGFTVSPTASLAAAKARVRELEKALRKIAEHPERSTVSANPSYAVGWAFWHVQQLASAALSQIEEGR